MNQIKKFLLGNKYGLSLIVIAFAIAICLLTGTTYGLWRLNFTQTTPNVVSTACFDMTFIELTSSVNLQNAYPISDEKGLETTPYTFKIANTCTQYGTYAVRLDILNTSTMSADKIKVQLEEASSISPTNLNSLETNSLLEPGISSSKVIVSDSLYEQGEKEYSLRIWIDSTAGNEVMNQQFNGRLTIDTIATEEPCASCGTLMVASGITETSPFLNSPSPVLRNNIESIVFADHKTVSGTSLGSWDVSSLQDNSVVAWYEDVDSDSKYEVTIGGQGGVKGNPRSHNLFRGFVNLEVLDLTNFNTSNVISMGGMFISAGYNSTIFTLGLGADFNISKVTDMQYMFQYTGWSNPNFTLDLRNFNVGSVPTVIDAFKTGNTSHKIYASSSNINFMSGKGFTGTIINCTTTPISCP